MPQLWLTYEELADEMQCAPSQARETAINKAWPRKKSRDGLSRVLMPPAVMQGILKRKALAALSAEMNLHALESVTFQMPVIAKLVEAA